MQTEILDDLVQKISTLKPVHSIGRVTATDGGRVLVEGLASLARLGDQVAIELVDHAWIAGEIVQIEGSHVTVMPDGQLSGLSLGARVILKDPLTIAPCDAWLGRIIDANGEPMDDRNLPSGPDRRPLKTAPPPAARRKGFGERLATGSQALNTLLPIVGGQRVGLFAGSGVGKTTLLGTIVRNISCDVAVVALVGERGRELKHFTHEVLGEEGMRKCVVVAATSDRSALERRRCAWTAMSIAEHFRDAGKSVLFVADSITRFAEAHREIATAAGEVPVLRGHPPSTAQLITELCERAGPGLEGSGDITSVLSVLVQGSDMDEPIADILRGVLDGHVILDRAIAERGRYPAINLLRSVSRSLPDAASPEENVLISKVRSLTSLYEQNAMMIRSGLYTEGTDPELDVAIKIWPELDSFLGVCGAMTPAQSFDRLRLILRRAGVR
ncbi:FliI/YscN family ATPase [Aliishimia ponticola]|uniref:FliI/YscN family ATPase n=1 Tax=Aliishimia ponticola TaxID=2499833 RepID=A0A4S4N8C9_9RHOB|nr:FliI/YscN family ATPase [Aliishimia ponticola]THH35456.1 FliI/YscN family ATPase [Aliishimia ponticola]